MVLTSFKVILCYNNSIHKVNLIIIKNTNTEEVLKLRLDLDLDLHILTSYTILSRLTISFIATKRSDFLHKSLQIFGLNLWTFYLCFSCKRLVSAIWDQSIFISTTTALKTLLTFIFETWVAGREMFRCGNAVMKWARSIGRFARCYLVLYDTC